MATRRCLKALVRHCNSVLSSNPSSAQTLKSLAPHLSHTRIATHACQSRFALLTYLRPNSNSDFVASRHFCTSQGNRSGDDDDASEVESCDVDDASEVESCDVDDASEMDSFNDERASGSILGNENKEKVAAYIGYKVIGPLEESDLVFKPYEPAFAVVQVGSHQFKVSNGDSIFTEKLKYCDVNDKLILNKVLMLGSKTQTIIGRPLLADAAVHAVVEEHALNAKVIIFKKKRRKNYRRTKGHRQELTKLRITNIQGIEKPEIRVSEKTEKTVTEQVEKVAVAA